MVFQTCFTFLLNIHFEINIKHQSDMNKETYIASDVKQEISFSQVACWHVCFCHGEHMVYMLIPENCNVADYRIFGLKYCYPFHLYKQMVLPSWFVKVPVDYLSICSGIFSVSSKHLLFPPWHRNNYNFRSYFLAERVKCSVWVAQGRDRKTLTPIYLCEIHFSL